VHPHDALLVVGKGETYGVAHHLTRRARWLKDETLPSATRPAGCRRRAGRHPFRDTPREDYRATRKSTFWSGRFTSMAARSR
jgi:hypothetical protein